MGSPVKMLVAHVPTDEGWRVTKGITPKLFRMADDVVLVKKLL